MACEVDHRKQQIAELLELAIMRGFRVELGELLVNLGPRT